MHGLALWIDRACQGLALQNLMEFFFKKSLYLRYFVSRTSFLIIRVNEVFDMFLTESVSRLFWKSGSAAVSASAIALSHGGEFRTDLATKIRAYRLNAGGVSRWC